MTRVEELQVHESVRDALMRIMQSCVMEGKAVRYWVMDYATFDYLRREDNPRDNPVLNYHSTEEVWKALDVTIVCPINRGGKHPKMLRVEAITT